MAESNFVDYIKIHMTSGNGGAGSAHLRREKYIPKGGPDGGDGGRGGHVIVEGNSHLWTLQHLRFQRHIKAGHGADGHRNRSFGADGRDEVVQVPIGTVIRDADTHELIGEIHEDGQRSMVNKDGRGGLGNWHFRSSTNQTPRYAQPGTPGEEGWVILELKVLADVGLVGFPNAGKSTLLAALTAAKPAIADYPFTTLTPNLGIVPYRDDRSFVMADIPGIIEGAAEGKGLGHRFLRHIERNSVLLFMIPADAEDAAREYAILLNELEKYNPELLDKSRVLAVSKSDLLDSQGMDKIEAVLPPDIPHVFISSITGMGLVWLKDLLWEAITAQRKIKENKSFEESLASNETLSPGQDNLLLGSAE